ncbi:MAG: magnesium chelatase, partial [Chitinophagales bacterium]|nr:magnesium chelatase [Chitinophagales bacterium]
MKEIKTLGELKKTGYRSRSIKEELRENLIKKLHNREPIFEGIIGYEHTVIPDVERAVLSGHNINFLGLRGQAKTKMARQLTNLLDEWMPVIQGSELNDDPLNPVSSYGKKMVEEMQDNTPVAWIHRSERYSEKLATPDVTVADLIGDIDPIKAANLRISYADERAIHYGIIPRSNRCIFVINELPDLQPRIQVALFNLLQEGDMQIRGYKMRMPLDILFVFTANPEDYTSRGTIITPLKDRIGSQILTHYPQSIALSKQITQQEAKLNKQQQQIEVSPIIADLVEQIAVEARSSEFVDQKSGVSARLAISAYQTVVSAAERRMLLNRESNGFVRISDLYAAIPAINGKIELVYEGETEGPAKVAMSLISKAIRNYFVSFFPDPSKLKKKKEESPYNQLIEWFSDKSLDILFNDTNRDYFLKLDAVEPIEPLLKYYKKKTSLQESYILKELILHGLAEHSQIGKSV